VNRPAVAAAAEASTGQPVARQHPVPAAVPRLPARPAKCASAYDGLPGPANTQSAALMLAACPRLVLPRPAGISGGAIAGSASGLVPAATRACRPTLVRELALRPRRDVRGVLLERIRRREHHRLRAGQPEPR